MSTAHDAAQRRNETHGDGKRTKKCRGRVVTSALVGATIEWYDFFLYGVVAGIVFNKLYFPASDPLVSTLLAYATFAVGFVTRPLGGVIFGHFGDRIGRKTMLVMTLMIMGVATVPDRPRADLRRRSASRRRCCCCCCASLQGIGLGGEWGGAVLMAYEYAPKEKRGFYASAAADRPGDRPVPRVGRRGAAVVAAHRRAVPRLGLARRVPALGRDGGGRHVHPPERHGNARVRRASRRETPRSRMPFVDMIRDYPGNVLKGMGARYIDGVFFNVFARVLDRLSDAARSRSAAPTRCSA